MNRLILAALLLLISPAQAQETTTCGPRAQILAALGKQFREQPIGMGLSKRGVIITLLTSPTRQTWTILITQPNGMTCAVDAGEGWESPDWLDYPTFGDGA